MGNYRFRLADMMPNVWFYKLKDMGKARNHITNTTHSLKKKQQASAAATSATISQSSTSKIKQQPHHSSYHHPRKSYYITRELITSDDHEQHQQHQTFQNSPTNAKSFPDPPRRSSSRQIHKRRTTATTTKSSSSPSSSSPKLLVTSSVSSGCSCKATLWTKPECPPDCSASPSDTSPEDDLELRDSFAPELFRSDSVLSTKQSSSFDSKAVSSSNSCGCKLGSNQNDIVIDVDNGSLATEKVDYFHSFDNISDIDLPPIITKAAKFDEKFEDMKKQETTTTSTSTSTSTTTTTTNRSRSMKHRETEIQNPLPVKIAKENVKRHSVNYQGHVRLRIHSPRIGSRRFQAHGRRSVSCSYSSSSSSRKSLSDSLAIVKASFDPRRDFRESMVEMIRENNIRASKDLEDLLACYLSLNSDEYHDLIINVFRQIWFDLTNTRLK